MGVGVAGGRAGGWLMGEPAAGEEGVGDDGVLAVLAVELQALGCWGAGRGVAEAAAAAGLRRAAARRAPRFRLTVGEVASAGSQRPPAALRGARRLLLVAGVVAMSLGAVDRVEPVWGRGAGKEAPDVVLLMGVWAGVTGG